MSVPHNELGTLIRPDRNSHFDRAKYLLEEAHKTTLAARNESVIRDPEGNEIPGRRFIAGIHLGDMLSAPRARVLDTFVERSIEGKLFGFREVDTPLSEEGVFYEEGSFSDSVHIPILPVPEISWNLRSVTRNQSIQLADLLHRIRVDASVLLAYGFTHIELGSKPEKDIPEGLLMEDNPDYKLELQFTPGFLEERELAKKVLRIFLGSYFLKRPGMSDEPESPIDVTDSIK